MRLKKDFFCLLLKIVYITVALSAYSNAFGWKWYHTPIKIYNDTGYDWTNVHTNSGYQAYFDSAGIVNVPKNSNLNTYANWQFQDNGFDNDNAAELFFTCNGKEYVLQMKGHHTGSTLDESCIGNRLTSCMYIRFSPNGLTNDDLEISNVEFHYLSTSKGNHKINDGYLISSADYIDQYDEIHITTKENKPTTKDL